MMSDLDVYNNLIQYDVICWIMFCQYVGLFVVIMVKELQNVFLIYWFVLVKYDWDWVIFDNWEVCGKVFICVVMLLFVGFLFGYDERLFDWVCKYVSLVIIGIVFINCLFLGWI